MFIGFINIEITYKNCKKIFLLKITLYKPLKTYVCQHPTFTALVAILNIPVVELLVS